MMQSQGISPQSCSCSSPGVWKARTQARTPRLCGCPSPCGSRSCLRPSNAVAGVGLQVPTTTSSPHGSPNTRTSPSTSHGGASPTVRNMNAPLQILARAAAEARIVPAPPAELLEVSSRLANTHTWPALQMLAVQYQGRLDQQGVVAVLQRAGQLTATATPSSPPTAAEQYACARFLESVSMSCASLIPTMGPTTVSVVLDSLGALAAGGLVGLRQVPYMVVVLVQALILASLPQLHAYSGAQLAFVLRGCALLSPSGLPEVWLDEWQSASCDVGLKGLSAEALGAVAASLETLYMVQNWLPADPWLRHLLTAVEDQMGAYDGQALRQLLTVLADLDVRPHSDWLGTFRDAFDARVAAAEVAPDDVAGVLYALTKLQVAFG